MRTPLSHILKGRKRGKRTKRSKEPEHLSSETPPPKDEVGKQPLFRELWASGDTVHSPMITLSTLQRGGHDLRCNEDEHVLSAHSCVLLKCVLAWIYIRHITPMTSWTVSVHDTLLTEECQAAAALQPESLVTEDLIC